MRVRRSGDWTNSEPPKESSSLTRGYEAMSVDTGREQDAAAWLGGNSQDEPSKVYPSSGASRFPRERRLSNDRFAAQIREVVNRNDLTTVLLGRGYNVYLPVYDRGVDLMAYREEDASALAIQLKGRWMIDRKYLGRSVWVAFKDDDWFVAPHDDMAAIGERLGYCATASWLHGGAFSSPRMSKPLRGEMERWRVGDSHSVLKAI